LLESFKSVLNTFLGAVFFHGQENTKAQTWVSNEGGFLTKIIGEYSLPMPELNWTILSNQLQFFWGLLEDQKKLQRHMAQFSVELDQVLQNAEVEMVKAKKIHETLIPKRSEEIKGIKFSNKYAAGEGGGGEFYDLIQTPSKIFQVLVSSQSYLISSAILGILGNHRNNDFNPTQFLKEAHEEIATINGAKKRPAEVDLLVSELDLNTLNLKLHGQSKAELYSQNKGPIYFESNVPYQLSRGEKVIVFSTGFIFNWREAHPEKKIQKFLEENSKYSLVELMPELFFQLKDGKETEFLTKDATVVMMEVNRHGIHKV
jgi:hypothetical protein